MALYGRLQANGEVTDIFEREAGPGDVELVARPVGVGPFAYDAPTKTAVEHPGFTREQRWEKRGLPLLLVAEILDRKLGAQAPLWARAMVNAVVTRAQQDGDA